MSAARTPVFSLRATLLIGLLLGVPFVIRGASSLEPFPALLFPAGALELWVERGHAQFVYLTVHAQGPHGAQQLQTSPLLLPMPPQYFFDVATGSQFGQNERPTQELQIKGFRALEVRRPVPTPEQRREALAWLKRRVHEQCPDATHVVLRIQVGEYDLQGRKLDKTSVQTETVVPLG